LPTASARRPSDSGTRAMRQSQDPKTVLITGASSGIGKGLALNYAGAGRRLFLHGRDDERLDAVTRTCAAKGAAVEKRCLDVRDRDAMTAWIEGIDRETPLDLVIANAGVSGFAGDEQDPLRWIFDINVNGVFNTVQPALPSMTERGRGHIAIMSSLAGFRGMPQAPAYAASKAAVRSWGEGLRGKLAESGVAISVICPGFVKTPMTEDNPFPMMLLMDADQAATLIRRGLDRQAARIAFPFRLYALTRLFSALPPAFGDRLLQRFQGKE